MLLLQSEWPGTFLLARTELEARTMELELRTQSLREPSRLPDVLRRIAVACEASR